MTLAHAVSLRLLREAEALAAEHGIAGVVLWIIDPDYMCVSIRPTGSHDRVYVGTWLEMLAPDLAEMPSINLTIFKGYWCSARYRNPRYFYFTRYGTWRYAKRLPGYARRAMRAYDEARRAFEALRG